MRRPIAKAVLAVAFAAFGVLGTAHAADDAGAPTSPVPACVRVQTQARWVPYGYNHIVILENGCSKPATCRVSTDVNPQVQVAEVEATKTVEVTTIMASPASTFAAKVACTLH